MNVIRNENIRPFDIDGTLILPIQSPLGRVIDVKDPVTGVTTIQFRVHEPMVRLLREELARGAVIIVWSRSGFQWAENVMRALGFVSDAQIYIMSKPMVYFDDKPVDEWLRDRVFLDSDKPYKDYNP